jgi:hypothetical protein
MEVRCHINDPTFQIKLEKTLDSLSRLYSLSTERFLEVWTEMPQPLRMGITRTAATAEHFEGTELEDLSDYCREIVGCYRMEYYKVTPKMKPFTLRNPYDLKQFGEFLDRMIILAGSSPGHFINALTQCPSAYWDKIDDLRETSYKLKRDSEEYLQCLEKCKYISFAYSELMDLLTQSEDDEYE